MADLSDPLLRDHEPVLRAALDTWGADTQLGMLHEEVGELLVAIGHYRRDRAVPEAVLDEIADVRIMLAQLELLLVDDQAELAGWVERRIGDKVARLARRVGVPDGR